MFVKNFLAPIQVRLSPYFLESYPWPRDEVIKFWKVKYWTPF